MVVVVDSDARRGSGVRAAGWSDSRAARSAASGSSFSSASALSFLRWWLGGVINGLATVSGRVIQKKARSLRRAWARQMAILSSPQPQIRRWAWRMACSEEFSVSTGTRRIERSRSLDACVGVVMFDVFISMAVYLVGAREMADLFSFL